jgi:hypothetical protein
MSVKNSCVVTKPSGRIKSKRVANYKVNVMGRDGPRYSCGKKALNRQILKVVYLEYVEIKHLQASLCPTGYRASAVASKLHGRLSMSGVSTPLKNGSVKPSERSEGDRSDVHLRRGIC